MKTTGRRSVLLLVCSFLILATEGTIIFNGNFNEYKTRKDFDTWSFSNQGNWPYQTYIYGAMTPPTTMSTFVDLAQSYRAPIDSTANQGIRVMINGSSHWNGNTMERTELVARIDQSAFSGVKYLHFSLAQDPTYPLNAAYEHQIMFFEAHWADIKLGAGYGSQLNFVTSDGRSVWTTDFGTNTWHNFAIQADFTGQKVSLYHSTGTNALTQVVPPTTSSVSSSEWHIGMLRLPMGSTNDPTAEYLYVSSVYLSDALMTFAPVSNTASIGSGTVTGITTGNSINGGGSTSGGGNSGATPAPIPTPDANCAIGAANCYCTMGGSCDKPAVCVKPNWVCVGGAMPLSASLALPLFFFFAIFVL